MLNRVQELTGGEAERMPLVSGKLRDVEIAVLASLARCMLQAFSDLPGLLYLQLSHSTLMQHSPHHCCVPEGSSAEAQD